VLLEVLAHQRLEHHPLILGQSSLFNHDLADRLVLFQDPRVHCGDQRVAGDEVHLERHDAEEQISIGGRL